MKTFIGYYYLIAEMECSLLSFTFAYTNLNGNGFHRNYGFLGVNFHFRPPKLNFEVMSYRSSYFRSLAEFLLAFGDHKRDGCFSSTLRVILGQFGKAQF